MEAKNEFLNFWFKGFTASLDVLSTGDRQKVLTECGRACSESFTKSVYERAWKEAAGDIKACIRNIQTVLSPDVLYEPVDEPGVPDGKCFDVVYPRCACELVKNGYLDTPLLCACSRQGLLYNWEAIVGKGNVSVEIKQTILSGASHCTLRVTFR